MLNHTMNELKINQVGIKSQPARSPWPGNAFRGVLLVADVGMGGLMLFGGRIVIFEMDRAMLFVGLVLTVLGLWLVVSGILLVAFKRHKCWNIGTCTHAVAGLGHFMLMAAIYGAQLPPERPTGHSMGVELDLGAIFSFVAAVLGILWLIAATVIFALGAGERSWRGSGTS